MDSTSEDVRLGWHGPTDWYWFCLTIVCVALLWCTTYNRWSAETWQTPVFYKGDAFAEMATAKAFATDHVHPVLTKHPASLGAPFTANWNDHLTVEEGVFAWYALLVRVLGLFVGSNAVLLSAHLLAAGSFYVVSRHIRVNAVCSFTFAILYALSSYAFQRNLQHLILTFYWHVPLGLLVISWCVRRQSSHWTTRGIVAGIAISVAFGVQNPYYTNIYVQLLGLAALMAVIRRWAWKDVARPLLFAAISLLSFVFMNLDTVFSRFSQGPNSEVVHRSYVGLELYALKPLEMVIPVVHRLASVEAWTRQAYVKQTMFIGEGGSPYLGVVAIVGLIWLGWSTLKGVARGQFAEVPAHFWVILWIVLYSVIGGINSLIGLWGMVLFRGTNRFSIVIMALALLFLGRELTRYSVGRRKIVAYSVALFFLLLGLSDQLRTPPSTYAVFGVRNDVLADKAMVAEMEAKLPKGSMIFELPVSEYPEVREIHQMSDYEHFRPYLHSRFLRYSYGSDKGRTRERWQRETEKLGAAGLIAVLERYGFAAVLLNQSGYADGGASLIENLQAAGRSNVIAKSGDLICIGLNPSPTPVLPPEFDANWHDLEGTADSNLRWSSGNAAVVVHNDGVAAKTVRASFGLTVARPSHIKISSPEGVLYDDYLEPAVLPRPVALTISAAPGGTTIRFETDPQGELPGNGDPRRLAFNVRDFRIEE